MYKKELLCHLKIHMGDLTPAAWNLIKTVRLTEEEQNMLHSMIETKTETITLKEAKAMMYTVVIS